MNHFLTKAIVPKLSLLLMFTLLNKVKKRDWNYAATEVYINKRRFRKRIKHTCWFTYISLHLYYCLYLFRYGSNTWLFWDLFFGWKIRVNDKILNEEIIDALLRKRMLRTNHIICNHVIGMHDTALSLCELWNKYELHTMTSWKIHLTHLLNQRIYN